MLEVGIQRRCQQVCFLQARGLIWWNLLHPVDFSWPLDLFEVNTPGGLVLYLKLWCCFGAWKLVCKAPSHFVISVEKKRPKAHSLRPVLQKPRDGAIHGFMGESGEWPRTNPAPCPAQALEWEAQVCKAWLHLSNTSHKCPVAGPRDTQLCFCCLFFFLYL